MEKNLEEKKIKVLIKGVNQILISVQELYIEQKGKKVNSKTGSYTIKKLKKGKSTEQIADELEEDINIIQKVVEKLKSQI